MNYDDPFFDLPDVGFFDPTQPITELRGKLPHWRQEGVTYFVTFHLADAIPDSVLRLWIRQREEWLRIHPGPHTPDERREYHRLFVDRFHRWLDAGHGECVLERRAIRQIMVDALRHFEGTRYLLREWVVMPNHVHTVLTPLGDWKLSVITHSWKSFTANKINKLLGRSGKLWHKESFDHIVRGPDDLERIELYIHMNARNLRSDQYTLNCVHKLS